MVTLRDRRQSWLCFYWGCYDIEHTYITRESLYFSPPTADKSGEPDRSQPVIDGAEKQCYHALYSRHGIRLVRYRYRWYNLHRATIYQNGRLPGIVYTGVPH